MPDASGYHELADLSGKRGTTAIAGTYATLPRNDANSNGYPPTLQESGHPDYGSYDTRQRKDDNENITIGDEAQMLNDTSRLPGMATSKPVDCRPRASWSENDNRNTLDESRNATQYETHSDQGEPTRADSPQNEKGRVYDDDGHSPSYVTEKSENYDTEDSDYDTHSLPLPQSPSPNSGEDDATCYVSLWPVSEVHTSAADSTYRSPHCPPSFSPEC